MADTRKIRKSGQIRRGAILNAATEVFLEKGYERATLAAIVAKSGGSRDTLYKLFGDKDGLFLTVVLDHASSILSALTLESPESVFGLPFDQALRAFAHRFTVAVMEPETVALMRVAYGEARKFPELGQQLYKGAPSFTAENLAKFLQAEVDRGTVDIASPEIAARCFLNMIQGDLNIRAMLDPSSTPTPEEIRECVDVAVTLFLRGIARRDRPSGTSDA